MASINRRRLKDGTETFRVGYRQDGKLRWSPTFHSAEGAAQLKDMIERIGPDAALSVLAARQGRAVSSSMPTLAAYFETHLERTASHATPGTVAGYRREAARTWLPHLGSLPLDTITTDTVRRWVAAQRQQETRDSIRARERAKREGRKPPEPRYYAPKSIANAQRLLSSVLDAAVTEEGYIERNPARGVKIPSDAVAHEKVYLTPAEFEAILAHVPDRWRVFVQTLYATGMRWGEATALQVKHVQLGSHAGTITIARAWKKGERGVYIGSPKSRRALRTIRIEGDVVTALADHIAGKHHDDLVFTSAQGKPIRPQNFHPRVWRPAVAASGIGKEPDLHSLRHSHVALLARHGVPIKAVQSRLGHESMQTTFDTYGHLFPDSDDQAAAIAAAALAPTFTSIEDGDDLLELEG